MLSASSAPRPTAPESALSGQLEAARKIITGLDASAPLAESPADAVVSEELEHNRWFPLPAEALMRLRAEQSGGAR